MTKKYCFDDFSFPFLMDLYRMRIKAEIRLDTHAVQSLQIHYPEIFTFEFQKFIEKLKIVATDLDQKYNENFSTMFILEATNKTGSLN